MVSVVALAALTSLKLLLLLMPRAVSISYPLYCSPPMGGCQHLPSLRHVCPTATVTFLIAGHYCAHLTVLCGGVWMAWSRSLWFATASPAVDDSHRQRGGGVPESRHASLVSHNKPEPLARPFDSAVDHSAGACGRLIMLLQPLLCTACWRNSLSELDVCC